MKSQPRTAASGAHRPPPRSNGERANSTLPQVSAAHVVEVTSAVEATALTASAPCVRAGPVPSTPRSLVRTARPSHVGQLLLHLADLRRHRLRVREPAVPQPPAYDVADRGQHRRGGAEREQGRPRRPTPGVTGSTAGARRMARRGCRPPC